MDTYRDIGLTASGKRLGQSHHKAELLDTEVELIRQLYARDGWKKTARPPKSFTGWTYKKLAEKFETNEYVIRDIVKCNRRWQHPTKFKRVRIKD